MEQIKTEKGSLPSHVLNALSTNEKDFTLIEQGLLNRGLLGFLDSEQKDNTFGLEQFLIEFQNGPVYFYTLDTSSENFANRRPISQGIIGYARKSRDNDSHQLFRFFNDQSKVHLYIVNPDFEALKRDGYNRDESLKNPIFIRMTNEGDGVPLFFYSNINREYFTPLKNDVIKSNSKSKIQGIQKSYDIFLLHSAKDERVAQEIDNTLKSWGFDTYFWSNDMVYGANWREAESRYILDAKLVLVLLGNNGWGEHQLRLAMQATELGKRTIPILIGNASKEARDEVDGMFNKNRYVDMTLVNDDSLNELRSAVIGVGIRPVVSETQRRSFFIEKIIQILIDGNELERSATLEKIIKEDFHGKDLSARLRSEIQRFKPTPEDKLSVALRPPDMLPSIRSWMISCLIWSDGEDLDNKNFILQHLNDGFEPSEHVRYWTLAGLYQTNVTYLNEAIIIASDSKEESVTRYLARAIESPTDLELIKLFNNFLTSGDPESWIVLRVLRIIPIRELAKNVCNLLKLVPDESALAYDIFYALLSREMTVEASKYLIDDPGVVKIVERLCTVLLGANPNGRRNLSRFLLAFDLNEVDIGIGNLLSNNTLNSVANEVQSFLKELRSGNEGMQQLTRPGFRSEQGDAEDFLDIEEDVKTLTAVILAKDVHPPLAIGLFGDWGHGKSFFMDEIKKEVKSINNSGNEKIFCTKAVQIEFNAWHYVDTSLWASLVSHILAELSNYVSPKATSEEQQASLLEELNSTSKIIEETKVQQGIAQKEIEVKQEELRKLQAEREQKKIKLKELRPEDIYAVLPEKEKKELKQVLNRLGLPTAIRSVSDLENVLNDTTKTAGRITSLFFSLLQSKNILIIIFILVIVMGAIPALMWWIKEKELLDSAVAQFGSVVTKFAAIIYGVSITLKNALGQINASVSKVEEIKKAAEKMLAEKRVVPQEKEVTLQKEINALNAREKEAMLILSSATQRVADLQERIRFLKEERSLNRFLVERTNSDDYRKHLGIISTIRQDFESLTTRLADAHQHDKKYKKVDRIILYIDDLDRCPSDKVIEVLQAVHLLLAYPLFVVIVGVDPRWLLHSLGSSFSAFQNEGKIYNVKKLAEDWMTTPQNFLEKIFQIQFSLKPMNQNGYTKLIENLFRNNITKDEKIESDHKIREEKGESFTTDLSSEQKSDVTTNSNDTLVQSIKVPIITQETNESNTVTTLNKQEMSLYKQHSRSPEMKNIEGGSINNERRQEGNEDKFIINEESLIIKEQEVDFASVLFDFIPSARATKRFSNVYRLLKASVPKKELATFEGSNEFKGDFQVPMLLLAIATGSPSEAIKLFPELQRSLFQNNSLNAALLEIGKSEDHKYRNFINNLNSVINIDGFPLKVDLFRFWIPKVSRFSFDLSRVLNQKVSIYQE